MFHLSHLSHFAVEQDGMFIAKAGYAASPKISKFAK